MQIPTGTGRGIPPFKQRSVGRPATEGGTLVRMEQSGFGPNQEANSKGANYIWQKFIGGLERVVAGLQ